MDSKEGRNSTGMKGSTNVINTFFAFENAVSSFQLTAFLNLYSFSGFKTGEEGHAGVNKPAFPLLGQGKNNWISLDTGKCVFLFWWTEKLFFFESQRITAMDKQKLVMVNRIWPAYVAGWSWHTRIMVFKGMANKGILDCSLKIVTKIRVMSTQKLCSIRVFLNCFRHKRAEMA